MGLKLYNSLTRGKDDFEPLNKGKVGMYICGPTVYGHSHLGHAKSYISFDILLRYLRYLGYIVTYVQNITDVGHLTDDADEGEDKLAVEAKKEKKHPMEIAEFYTRSYFEDMDKVNNLRPNISPRASGHIIEQIELVETLLEKGYAYEVNGSVYFDVAKFEDYGKLSGRNIEDMQAGARVEVSEEKRNPVDFALWKKAEPNHIMQWKSPWGMGYPGWHVECSVMAMKYLGKTIDIHGGGLENQFPHHECEIAQSEAANGVPFVRYWLHNNMVTVDGQKMGKSLNNFITLKQVFSGAHERLKRGYDPLAVRQLVLNSHYRSPLDFSDEALYAAQSGYEKINEAAQAVRKKTENLPPKSESENEISKETAGQLEKIKEKFENAMNDDLNTAVALSAVFELVKTANSAVEENSNPEDLKAIDDAFSRLAGDCLGVLKQDYEQQKQADDRLTGKLVELLIEERAKARAEKDFETADRIRDKLAETGVILKDKPEGTEWSIK